MGLLFDIHLHTRRHSACSRIDESQLIAQAVRKGLSGCIITEHHYQWGNEELRLLIQEAGELGFVVLAGFEYTSACGDILIYGLKPEQVAVMQPFAEPQDVVSWANGQGAVCIAAHPTRMSMGFDERITTIPFHAMEVQSVNLKPHEQRLAQKVALSINMPQVTCSDAHRIEDVGAYAVEFDQPIQSMADFKSALTNGCFRAAGKLA